MVSCFPRQTCRGLIEAGRPGPARKPEARAFPGKLAGASLKRQRVRRGASPPPAFPGKLAGASLKLVGHVLSSGLGGAFPGKLAGASLKPRHPRGPRAARRPFPGKLAGASLKQWLSDHWPAGGEWLSPANLPGPH